MEFLAFEMRYFVANTIGVKGFLYYIDLSVFHF